MSTYPIHRAGPDERAACRDDPELMFPPPGNAVGPVKAAKKKCHGVPGETPPCPLLAACLDYALRHAVAGIWGGKTEGERKKLQKKYRIKPERLSLAGMVPMGPGTRSSAPHGTPGAIGVHNRKREPLCDPCAVLRAQKRRERQERQRAS